MYVSKEILVIHREAYEMCKIDDIDRVIVTFKANIPNRDDPWRARSDSEGRSVDALLMNNP